MNRITQCRAYKEGFLQKALCIDFVTPAKSNKQPLFTKCGFFPFYRQLYAYSACYAIVGLPAE